ncbi:hypothetical protein [Povalibacter sp.]|uniref:hypothetical protein n=1 Tax=Povalibacter sp. TaxID=1962978 RepID=UPI002F4095DA
MTFEVIASEYVRPDTRAMLQNARESSEQSTPHVREDPARPMMWLISRHTWTTDQPVTSRGDRWPVFIIDGPFAETKG